MAESMPPLEGFEPTPAPKKRVRATIADTIAIGRALENHVGFEWPDGDLTNYESDKVASYQRGWTDERIAKEYVPHLAAHHVAVVREALYPKWEKRTADLTVEERLEALSLDTMSNIERLGKIEQRLDALDEALEERLA